MRSILHSIFPSITTVVLLILLASTCNVFAKPLSVVLVPLGSQKNEFWGRVIDFTEAVAEDLDVELEVAITDRATLSSIHFRKILYGILTRSNKPDYILIPYWVGSSDMNFVNECRRQNIKVFLFNARIPSEHQLQMGTPRKKFKNWIGQMHPDDTKAGYELAKTLSRQATLLSPNTGSPRKISALKGQVNTHISDIRYQGLKQFILESNQIMGASFNTTWRRNSASMATTRILEEHPDTSIIWAVGDEIALGAIDILKSLNIKPGKDVFVGGFDGLKLGVDAVKSGDMTVTMGGHFVEGGWSLMLIYDYHHGHDFIGDPGLTYITPLRAITAENIDEYMKLTSDHNWRKIDFKQYSKTHNPKLQKYDFSLEGLYRKLKAAK